MQHTMEQESFTTGQGHSLVYVLRHLFFPQGASQLSAVAPRHLLASLLDERLTVVFLSTV